MGGGGCRQMTEPTPHSSSPSLSLSHFIFSLVLSHWFTFLFCQLHPSMNRSHVSNTSSFWRFAYQKPTISFGCRDDDDNDDYDYDANDDDAGHFVVCCSLLISISIPLLLSIVLWPAP